MKILIVKPSSLGDVVHTMPAANILRRAFPEAHIAWLVNDTFSSLVELSSDINEVIIFPRKKLKRLINIIPTSLELIKTLRSAKFDVVFDFQGLFRSAFFSRCCGAPRVIGFKNARELAPLFYKSKVEVPGDIKHAVDRYNLLVNYFIGDKAPKYQRPELKSFDEYVNKAKELLARYELFTNSMPIVAVASTSRWETKTWSPDFFAEVMDKVYSEIPTQFWLSGTDEERSIGQEIVKKCKIASPINWMGHTNIGTSIELYKKSCCLLTNDSGPMHIGAILGKKIFALFGPTDAELTGPYTDIDKREIFSAEVSCRPCFSRKCELKNEDKLCCQHQLPSDTVANSIISYLKTITNGDK